MQFGSAERFFPGLCFIRGEMKSLDKRGLLWASLERNNRNMRPITNKPAKLRKAPQPPLSYPGAPPDSDRAKRPPLAEAAASDQELNPGDRVEGLENQQENSAQFSKPTTMMRS